MLKMHINKYYTNESLLQIKYLYKASTSNRDKFIYLHIPELVRLNLTNLFTLEVFYN